MADYAYGGLGAGGAGQYYAMTDQQRRELGSNPNGATNDYSALARQMHAPGLGAQADMLDMYQMQALGQGPPSAAQQQLAQAGQQQQRMLMGAGAHSGDISGAIAQQSGAAAQQRQQQELLQAAQMQQALAGYAGLGTQMQQQGFRYDALNQQQLAAAQGLRTDWYLGDRQADMAAAAANSEFNRGLLNAGIGLAGGLTGGASMMMGRR